MDCSITGSSVRGDSPGSGLPCPPPGDRPNPRIKPWSPTLQADCLLSEPLGRPKGNFLTQELNQGLLHCKQILYQLSWAVLWLIVPEKEAICLYWRMILSGNWTARSKGGDAHLENTVVPLSSGWLFPGTPRIPKSNDVQVPLYKMVKYSYLSLSRGFTSMVSSNYGSPSIHNGLKNWVKLAFYFGVGNGNPLQYSCLENAKEGGVWWAAVHGIAESRTRLSDFTFTFMHWRRKWGPTPVFLLGESQGQGSLVGCHLWGRTESDTTEAT